MSDKRPQLHWDAPVPTGYLRNAAVIDRLMYRTSETADGCWTWRGGTCPSGYGEIGAGGDNAPTLKVHRVSYEHFVGPIPEGFTIDHLCRNPSCVNPGHLEPVTLAENLRRAWDHRRANGLCINGLHEMTPENTLTGRNRCRECALQRNRNYKARKAAAA